MGTSVELSFGDDLHLVLIVHFDELLLNQVVVGAVGVVEAVDVVEYRLHLGDVARRAHPQLFFRVAEVARFDVLHLINGVVSLFPPLQLLIQEVHHREVVGPDVVAARQVHIVVGVQGGEGDRASEVDFAALGQRLLGNLVEVALGQPEVHDVDAAGLAAQHEVRSLHVAVDEAPLVDLPNRGEHLGENVDRNFEAVVLLEAAAHLGQINCHQVHHDQVLLRIVDKVVHVGHVLQP